MKKKLRLTCLLFALCSLLFAILLTACGGEEEPADETTVTITFDTNGSPNKVASVQLEPGGKLPASYFGTGNKVPKYPGNRFDGWLNGSTPVTAATTFTKSATLTAQWVRQITVSFSFGAGVSGNPPRAVTIDEGTALGSKYPTPARAGWEFEGWFFNDTLYTNSTIINTDGETFTLTARWKEDIDHPPEYADAPAIHPGRHLAEVYPDGLSVKAGVEFTIQGLSSNIERGGGFLTAKWYRATTPPEQNNYSGTVVSQQSASDALPHDLSLKCTTNEQAVGEFWYWVEVNNYNEKATITKNALTKTMNQLKVTVTGN